MENEETNKNLVNEPQGSQVSPVSRFGNSPEDKQEALDIKSRIDGSRNRNLNSAQPVDTGVSNNNNSSTLGDKSGLDEGKSGNKSKASSSSSTGKVEGPVGTGEGATSSKSDVSGNSGKSGKLSSIGGLIGNSAMNLAANNNETARKAVNTVNTVKTAVKVGKAIVSFFTTPVGWIVGFILLILTIAIVIIAVFGTLINSLGSFFGLTGNQTYETFNEKYEEMMSREEIENTVTELDALCDESFFTSLKHTFDIWGLSNSCELAHYVKNKIDEKKSETKITTISPGYLLSALYYAYDSQEYIKANDELEKESGDDVISSEEISDLDAITTLIGARIYDETVIDTLLDNYVMHDVYPYYRHECSINPITREEVCSCSRYNSNEYHADEKKFELFLRYGENVANSYVYDSNRLAAYNATSRECKSELGFNSSDIDMNKYDKKADLTIDTDDNAKITIDAGINVNDYTTSDEFWPNLLKYILDNNSFIVDPVSQFELIVDRFKQLFIDKQFTAGTYGYDSGFIFNTYPRYDSEYNNLKDTYNDNYVAIDKDIENIISDIESRQDYTNYILGYPSDLQKLLASKNRAAGNVCSYNVDGNSVSNIKVRLLHSESDVPGVNRFDPIESEELVDFENYILGVVYGEMGTMGFNAETYKTQAIAARSYAFARVKAMSGLSLSEEDGQWILTMRNSDEDMAYCNPDKGCYRCEGYRHTIFSEGSTPEGVTCTLWAPPLSQDSYIRSAVREVMGMVMVDENNNSVHSGWLDVNQREWESLALQGKDYVEILQYTYPGTTISSNTCSYASGEWSSWRQYSEPWGNMLVGSKTMSSIGCFLTSYSIIIAKSSAPLKIYDFNPGTFLEAINENNCINRNNDLDSSCALRAAVVSNNITNNGISLYGRSYNEKVSIITNYINRGYEIVLRVKSRESAQKYGESSQHWVAVVGVDGDNILMVDPASDETIVLNKYHDEGIVYFNYIKFE